jgi:inner membrane protein
MDLITHAGLGALSARTLKARLPLRWSLGAAVLGAVLPDSDFVLLLVDPLSFHAYWHRSSTHSLVMLPLWGALPGWLLYRVSRRRQPFLLLWLYACLGVASHIALDMMTAWDIALLWPVGDWRVSLGWLFIIDPWFTVPLLAGLVAALRWQPAAWLGWLWLALWLGWSASNKQEARERAAEFATTLDLPARVEAWPQPFSPYHWKLLASTDEGHWQAHAHLGEQPSPLASLWPHPWLRGAAGSYRPLGESSWEYHSRFAGPKDDGDLARQLWRSNTLRDFRSFARHPARFRSDDTPECIWFTDLLYVIPEQRPPFIYGACRDEQGNWQRERKD